MKAYRLIQDNDGHWFVILCSQGKEFYEWAKAMENDDYDAADGMPDLPFFRWDPDHPRTPGKQFGRNLFYQWWKRACADLGVEGVDLYAGVRHSTVTAAGEGSYPREATAGLNDQELAKSTYGAWREYVQCNCM